MAGADVNRIGFALKEYRTTAPIEDLQVFSRHPLAVETDYNTLFRNEADASAFGQQILALRKMDRWNWACYITRGRYQNLQVGQTVTLTYPRYGFQNGADFILKKIRRDAGALFDEIVLFGPKGITFESHLLGLDFTSGEYWRNGVVTKDLTSLSGYVSTRTGEQGARDIDRGIDYFPANVQAINGLGLHGHNTLTNHLHYSQDFTQDYILECSVSPNTFTAPDGTLTMDKVIPTAVSSPNHIFGRLEAFGTNFVTQSIFAKAAGYTRLWAGAYDSSVWHSVGFDLANGTVLPGAEGSAVGYIHDYGNGIYRCVLNANTALDYGSTSGVVWFPKPAAATDRGYIFTGNGTDGVYVWQRQLTLHGTGVHPDGGPILRTLSGADAVIGSNNFVVDVKAGAVALTEDFYCEGVAQVSANLQTRRVGWLYNLASSTVNQFFVQISGDNTIRIYGANTTLAIGPIATIPPQATFSWIYSYVQATKTLQFGVRVDGKTYVSAPTSSIPTDVTGLNKLSLVPSGIGHTIQKFVAVKLGTLTTDQMTARLSALLGE